MATLFRCLLLTLLLTGCEFFSRERTYRISAPVLPEGYGFITSWDIEIIVENGSEDVQRLPVTGGILSLTLEKETACLILYRGCAESGFTLYPAGLYLDGLSGNEMTPSFGNGPALSLLAEAVRLGFDLRSFNCPRFLREFREVESLSPWFLDRERIRDALTGGDFTLRDLRQKELYPFVPPADGLSWVGEDPLAEPGNPPFLPPGNYRFFCPVPSRIREVSLNDRGEAIILEYSP